MADSADDQLTDEAVPTGETPDTQPTEPPSPDSLLKVTHLVTTKDPSEHHSASDETINGTAEDGPSVDVSEDARCSLKSMQQDKLYEWLNETLGDKQTLLPPARVVNFTVNLLEEAAAGDDYADLACCLGIINIKKSCQAVNGYRKHNGEIILFRDHIMLEKKYFSKVSWHSPFSHIANFGDNNLRKLRALVAYYFLKTDQLGAGVEEFVEIGGVTKAKLRMAIIMVDDAFKRIAAGEDGDVEDDKGVEGRDPDPVVGEKRKRREDEESEPVGPG
jgi:hypothetical protein